MIHAGVEFRNVAQMHAQESDEGLRLQRCLEQVRCALNERAQDRMLIAAGTEIRFVAEGCGPIAITLSSPMVPSREAGAAGSVEPGAAATLSSTRVAPPGSRGAGLLPRYRGRGPATAIAGGGAPNEIPDLRHVDTPTGLQPVSTP